LFIRILYHIKNHRHVFPEHTTKEKETGTTTVKAGLLPDII